MDEAPAVSYERLEAIRLDLRARALWPAVEHGPHCRDDGVLVCGWPEEHPAEPIDTREGDRP